MLFSRPGKRTISPRRLAFRKTIAEKKDVATEDLVADLQPVIRSLHTALSSYVDLWLYLIELDLVARQVRSYQTILQQHQ